MYGGFFDNSSLRSALHLKCSHVVFRVISASPSHDTASDVVDTCTTVWVLMMSCLFYVVLLYLQIEVE